MPTDPKRPPLMQDKRSVIPIALEDVDLWLFETVGETSTLLRLQPVDLIVAGTAV